MTSHGNQTIADYFTKLKTLWDELENYQTVRTCTCGGAKDLNKHLEEEKIHQFSIGLDSKMYGTVRSNVLSLEPLPTLNKVYAFVAREERQQNTTKGQGSRDLNEEAAFKATTSHNRPNWSRNQNGPAPEPPRNAGRPRCSHCQKLGQEKHQRYELVGYPSNWGERRGNRSSEGRGRGGVKLWGTSEGRGRKRRRNAWSERQSKPK